MSSARANSKSGYCDSVARSALEGQDLVGLRVLLECVWMGRAQDLDIGAVAAHQALNCVICDAAGIGTELSHGPRHTCGVDHLWRVEEVTHWREAKGPNAAHHFVLDNPTALGHENEVDCVRGIALDQREAVHDGHVDLGLVVCAARDDDGVLAHG